MLQMRPMTQGEFRLYRQRAVSSYARDLIESGQNAPVDADERASACLDVLLPDGLLTDNQVLLTVRESAQGEVLAFVWYAVVEEGPHRTLFIYDLDVEPAFRRQGVATRVLLAIEDEARELRVTELGLSVFNHNAAARALYRGQGYAEVTTTMIKPVASR
ncbi:GNAT family N-acetyltransferase [Burkholderia alba]|uniref:GNAT family N-acetyltransferase n=1 Tax=Burkholderia alba TaxID=2683677 RepID=UPI002B051A74|nr:GNAT family N-acetyltransferase [Burkholderia alba]